MPPDLPTPSWKMYTGLTRRHTYFLHATLCLIPAAPHFFSLRPIAFVCNSHSANCYHVRHEWICRQVCVSSTTFATTPLVHLSAKSFIASLAGCLPLWPPSTHTNIHTYMHISGQCVDFIFNACCNICLLAACLQPCCMQMPNFFLRSVGIFFHCSRLLSH